MAESNIWNAMWEHQLAKGVDGFDLTPLATQKNGTGKEIKNTHPTTCEEGVSNLSPIPGKRPFF